MQALGAGLDPAIGHGEGIFGKYSDVVHPALAQANALAVLDVDGGDEQHDGPRGQEVLAGEVPSQRLKLESRRRPACWLFSG